MPVRITIEFMRSALICCGTKRIEDKILKIVPVFHFLIVGTLVHVAGFLSTDF